MNHSKTVPLRSAASAFNRAVPGKGRLCIRLARETELELIYHFRHEVYASELGQHPENAHGKLTDSLDGRNIYLVAAIGEEIFGFISITPPGAGLYSIDKYFARTAIPIEFDPGLYEIRLLTVLKEHRRSEIAFLLMYSAFRWVEAHRGTRVVAIGRREILALYLKAGLEPLNLSVKSGAVTFDLLHGRVEQLRQKAPRFNSLLHRAEHRIDWQFRFPFRPAPPCFHGGAFFSAIGEKFDALERKEKIISADVLDAWFPPSPKVTAALQANMEWLLRTSPPTHCEGLIETIARVRGVPPSSLLAGAGSSALIFLTFRHWLNAHSRALILDPTYGEYPHVLEKVIGCRVDRFSLERASGYELDFDRFQSCARNGYDLLVLVNPNSPTGRLIGRQKLEQLFRNIPRETLIWIDETYIDYCPGNDSLEQIAAQSENLIVCKSMSKAYGLSGGRVAYLCAGAHLLESLRPITPPWPVSLPAQVAAVHALQDPQYYETRYAETHLLREELSRALRQLGWDPVPGVANFLLCHLPSDGPDAESIVQRCRKKGLYLRNAAQMGTNLGNRAVRIAVKDRQTNARMLDVIRHWAVAGEE